MIRVFALVSLMASVASAAEPSLGMMTRYEIQPIPVPQGERELAARDWVLKQPLFPGGLAELTETVELKPGKPPLSVGQQLIAVDVDVAAVRCVATVNVVKWLGERQTRPQPCFVDADRDNKFESYFSAVSEVSALLVISGRFPKKLKPLPKPVGYRDIDPSQHRPQLFVGIERRNFFNIYNTENFMIVFGSDGQTDEITAPVSVKSIEMPKALDVLGARFVALSESAGKMRVRVDAAMPRQPFGVYTSTSYMFIPGR